ncbi:hypothetical protein JM658_06905 [Joostella atrarenae]|uniref:Dihydrolipoamide dehydrogenase n=1 Tax=Joostella atrarenae TaxID=679257 RepID=A0ABS9J2B0_9FLAO|nr:hypothetical protein [Joostella atrarenae]MCF8714558.1 hypothetical protein [Joostella atrarenae]
MKKIITLLFVSALILTSCSGEDGRDGLDGMDGVNIVGETFEYNNVSFSETSNVFEATFDPPLVEGDVMLAYRLESVFNGQDVWEPLPTVFFNPDTGDDLRHRFNFTLSDINIIAETSNFSAFGEDLLSNQTFRVVIVPSDLINEVDTSNINEVMEAANISTIQKMN